LGEKFQWLLGFIFCLPIDQQDDEQEGYEAETGPPSVVSREAQEAEWELCPLLHQDENQGRKERTSRRLSEGTPILSQEIVP